MRYITESVGNEVKSELCALTIIADRLLLAINPLLIGTVSPNYRIAYFDYSERGKGTRSADVPRKFALKCSLAKNPMTLQ